jgi:hypothetical protein
VPQRSFSFTPSTWQGSSGKRRAVGAGSAAIGAGEAQAASAAASAMAGAAAAEERDRRPFMPCPPARRRQARRASFDHPRGACTRPVAVEIARPGKVDSGAADLTHVLPDRNGSLLDDLELVIEGMDTLIAGVLSCAFIPSARDRGPTRRCRPDSQSRRAAEWHLPRRIG